MLGNERQGHAPTRRASPTTASESVARKIRARSNEGHRCANAGEARLESEAGDDCPTRRFRFESLAAQRPDWIDGDGGACRGDHGQGGDEQNHGHGRGEHQ